MKRAPRWLLLLLIVGTMGCQRGPGVEETRPYEAVKEDVQEFDRLIKEIRTALSDARSALDNNDPQGATEKVESIQAPLAGALQRLESMEKGLRPPKGRIAKEDLAAVRKFRKKLNTVMKEGQRIPRPVQRRDVEHLLSLVDDVLVGLEMRTVPR